MDKKKKVPLLSFLLLSLPAPIIVYISFAVAPYLSGGIINMLLHLGEAVADFSKVHYTSLGLQLGIIFLCAYIVALIAIKETKKNYRLRVEHGSAEWGSAGEIRKKYMNKRNFKYNKIFTENVYMDCIEKYPKRNLNTLVIGGSGAGKTRSYSIPNTMNATGSVILLDPKAEIFRSTSGLLEKNGYRIITLNLISPENSFGYNPFDYLYSDNDVQRLVSNLFMNTQTKGGKSQDPFWDQTAMMLLMALILYLKYEAPKSERNFNMVMDMIRAGEVKEDNDKYLSALDRLFLELEDKNPEHIALKYYRNYKAGSGKTLKSIQITLLSRLEKFNLPSIAAMTNTDEMRLDEIGTTKTALYAIIPDNDSSFNFIVGMLYTQLFQRLYYQADFIYGGSLPVAVHLIMDEFANVSLPSDFDKLLSTMRSRNISVSIILQNLSQLKKIYEKEWESIVGNCDELLYLGGNESSTHEYISKLLGKETIDYNTFGKSSSHGGSFTKNYNIAGRELLTPDEVRMLPNTDALLFIRGERPVKDRKYDIKKHPDYKASAGMSCAEVSRDTFVGASIIFSPAVLSDTDNEDDGEIIFITEENLLKKEERGESSYSNLYKKRQ